LTCFDKALVSNVSFSVTLEGFPAGESREPGQICFRVCPLAHTIGFHTGIDDCTTDMSVELASFMNPKPRRFVLQALDPDHGSPVLEAAFFVSEVEDLRALLADAGEDPALERGYFLDAAELAAINQRFGVAFDPGGREVLLEPWHSIRDVPYLIHTGYELPLLLEGRKQLARFKEAYPPDQHWTEEKFDRHVAEGTLHKEVTVEPFEKLIHLKDGQVVEGTRTVYYTRKGEEWRIPASKLVWAAAAKSKWSFDFERMEGTLFGYEEWQNDWWIEHLRKRGRKFGISAHPATQDP
jgi:hypothetical protein